MGKQLREIVLSALAALFAALVALGLHLPVPWALLLTALATLALPVAGLWRGRSARNGRTQAFIQRLIDVIPEPVYIKDKNGRYQMVNQAFARQQNKPVSEVVGKTATQIFGNEYAGMVVEEDARILAGRNIFKEEHSPNPVTGEERFQLVSKQSCEDVDGQAVIIGTNFNITTWRVAERNLQMSLARETELRVRTQTFVQRLIDVIPDPVYVKNGESRFLMINDAFARERRRPKSEIVGLTSFDLAPNRQTGELSALEDQAVLAGGEVQKEQHTSMPVTGEECFRIVSKRRCVDADGNAVVVGAHFYITRWKLAERDLQAALQREVARRERTQGYVQRLIDVIPQPVYVRDADSRYVMVNAAFARERDMTVEQILGHTPAELSPNSSAAGVSRREDEEVLAGRIVLKEENRTLSFSPKEQFRIISKRACLDAEGQTVIVGANFDITSWREAERELQATLENQSRMRGFLQSVFDALPTPLFVEDAKRRFVMANRALAKLIGQPVESLIGRRVDALDSPELSAGLALQHTLLAMPEGQIHEGELKLADMQGKQRHFMTREVISRGTDMQPVRIGVLTDITSLRETETRWLLAKEAAEQSSAAKSLFLANMSHEIRTPLNGVIGTLRLALRDTSLTGTTLEYVRASLANAESLLSIISDILDFSKIEAGQLKIEKIDLELPALVRDTLQVFREHAAVKSLLFSVDIDSALPRYLRGDPTRIRQVLINLVGNAVKFTESGTVAVSIHREEARGMSHVVFRVRDSGIGIPTEALSRIFQKFQQADTSTTRRYGGTGLGLAICRQLVEAMGGEISVSSQEGTGSTFEFFIPLEEGHAPVLSSETALRKHSHRLSVLCAEDVAVNKIIVRALLEHMGHKVDIVDSGLAAIQALSKNNYDVVLMDGHMPEMSGQEAARAIRNGGIDGIKVGDPKVMMVALTADASLENQQECLAAGMDAYLTKPIEERLLHGILASVIVRQMERGAALEPLQDETADATPAVAAPVKAASLALRGMVDEDMVEELLPVFVKMISSALAEVDDAIKKQDFAKLAEVFHSLKGSIGYLSDDELYQRAVSLESAAKARNANTITQALPPLRNALMAFVQEHR